MIDEKAVTPETAPPDYSGAIAGYLRDPDGSWFYTWIQVSDLASEAIDRAEIAKHAYESLVDFLALRHMLIRHGEEKRALDAANSEPIENMTHGRVQQIIEMQRQLAELNGKVKALVQEQMVVIDIPPMRQSAINTIVRTVWETLKTCDSSLST